MKTGMEDCGCCQDGMCPMEPENRGSNCIFNLIIYQNENKVLFYNSPYQRIYLINKGKGLKEIDFQDAIREIDTIPEKQPEWKKNQILKLAKDLGFFGISA